MKAPIRFHSTNRRAPVVDFRQAFLAGLAPDRGLYLPEIFPTVSKELIAEFSGTPYHEVAFHILSRYTCGIIPDQDLATMCRESYDLDVPFENVYGRVYVMRLDQGPTASFKDFAARMMARMFGWFLSRENRRVTILTATSGDTGSAVAHAFHGIPGVRVIVLFPEAEVSESQRKLMTTLRENIRTVAIRGKFDDCQAMVKQAFADVDLAHLSLSSANSINIGRLLPQVVYYFYAASRLARDGDRIVYSVPSGNFGNMMGAVLAREMGLPVRKIVAPVNDNDAFPRFLASGVYQRISPSRNSLSNAMNVGHPSNIARLVAVYGGQMDESGNISRQPDLAAMRRDIYSTSISDARTRAALKRFWDEYNILLEPHGAVAWQGFVDWSSTEPSGDSPVVIVETANPGKFPEEIQRMMNWAPDVPACMRASLELPEDFDRIEPDYTLFKDYLMQAGRK